MELIDRTPYIHQLNTAILGTDNPIAKLLYKAVVDSLMMGEVVDAEPVIRCKDCRFSSKDGGYDYIGQSDTHVNCLKRLTRRHGILITPKDGFCSDGEPKELPIGVAVGQEFRGPFNKEEDNGA